MIIEFSTTPLVNNTAENIYFFGKNAVRRCKSLPKLKIGNYGIILCWRKSPDPSPDFDHHSLWIIIQDIAYSSEYFPVLNELNQLRYHI